MNDEIKKSMERLSSKCKESLESKTYTDSMRNYLLGVFGRTCSELLTWSDLSGIKVKIVIEN